jgi:hypothetical protein
MRKISRGGIEFKCKICGNRENNNIFEIKEMMFGLGETFEYIECQKCGCLQIKDIPKNMDKYYSNDYHHSFDIKCNIISPLKRYIINRRNGYCILKNSIFGKLVNIKYHYTYFSILGDLNLSLNTKILDVGCGLGGFLYQLKEMDFNELTGIDLYLETEI